MQKPHTYYYRNYYLKRSIPFILSHSTDVFDEAAEVIIFRQISETLESDLPENVQVFPEYLRITSCENCFDKLKNLINWNMVDTVLIYKRSCSQEVNELLLTGKKVFLDYITELQKTKKNLDPEWEFIYSMKPDLFLTKKNTSVMIGSLSNRVLTNLRWNIPDNNNNKADLINDQNV